MHVGRVFTRSASLVTRPRSSIETRGIERKESRILATRCGQVWDKRPLSFGDAFVVLGYLVESSTIEKFTLLA
ncbi:hypothetical protein M404DRAFT_1006881 [Pisolithus tinctorius Marx 270]|uniref:Uncharacterized protein n=1 Tax=Pisolithus tinctorius Marx 270 TaxID=870435 RepID=A0A0C3N5B8_PISTI|nr:hypothetical protein M404DRAFT_1006881 [Pisolithus tinctorius Marx 270]